MSKKEHLEAIRLFFLIYVILCNSSGSKCHTLGCPDFVLWPLGSFQSSLDLWLMRRKKNTQQMLEWVDSVYIIKYKILSISAEILAQTQFLFPVVISVFVKPAMFPKCQNKDKTIAYPLVKKK